MEDYLEWVPSISGELKLNVYGSSLGKPGPTTNGGIFRDYRGHIRGCLSNILERQTLTLLTSVQFLRVCCFLEWKRDYILVIESSS